MGDPAKKPLGDSLRDLINPALEDDRRIEIQRQILNDAFEMWLDKIEMMLEGKYRQAFNRAAKLPESGRNPSIIRDLTEVKGQDGEPRLNPVLRLPLPIATGFTAFTPDDVKDLPAYIDLHMRAREMNVSVKVTNLLADEGKSPSGFALPPLLIIDATKSYDDGAFENSHLYPNLPPVKAPFDGSAPREFDL